MEEITSLQKEILKMLKTRSSSYASPVPSDEIGRVLNVTPSYIREQMKNLQIRGWVCVRNGPGGGYYLETLYKEDNDGAL